MTTLGHGADPGDRKKLGMPGAGPVAVITDLGVLRPDPPTAELALTEPHPEVSVEQVRAATGWELRVSDELGATEPPTPEELAALRALKNAGKSAGKDA